MDDCKCIVAKVVRAKDLSIAMCAVQKGNHKAMMTIGQVSEHTGLSIHALRYYEQIGLVNPVARLENGHRVYSEDDVNQIDFVLCMRSGGMSIAGLKCYMDLVRQGEETVAERLGILEAHQATIEQKIEELSQYLVFIHGKIAHYRELHKCQLEQKIMEAQERIE